MPVFPSKGSVRTPDFPVNLGGGSSSSVLLYHEMQNTGLVVMICLGLFAYSFSTVDTKLMPLPKPGRGRNQAFQKCPA